jgi:asparagine synthase (glutamine-hydrolysing)
LKTFSVTFRGRSFDESRYIRQVSRRYGTEHYELDLGPAADLAGTIEEISYFSDEPGADAGALPLWYLSQLTAKHVKVVLSGEGADELFAGYLTYKANRLHRLATMIPQRFRLAALAAAMRLPVADDKISFEYKLKRFLRGSLFSPEAAHVFWNGTFSSRERQDIYHYFSNEPMSDLLAGITRPLELQSYLDFDQNYYLPDDILYKVDRMSMAHSLEARPPFLDHRIVEFAAQLPAKFKLSRFTSKLILRKLMAGRLPAEVLKRPKVGLDIPIHDWFRGPLKGFLLDTLSERRILRAGLFSWLAIDNLITAHLQRKANVGYHLWGLMTLLLWIERWKIQPPPRSLQQSLELDASHASLVERAG